MIAVKQNFLFCTALLVFAVAGCGANPQAQFAWRDATIELIPDAEKAVKNTITDHFGTPHDIVAWDRLPVDYGGVRGTVAAPAEGVTLQPEQLFLEWSGPTDKVKPDDPVLWVSGPKAADKDPTDTVKSFDSATGVLQLASSGEVPAGSQLAIGFGKQMQLGRVAYMRNCMHCHGVAGDGNGPTAKYLNPLPRDYRLGIFKFTSTNSMSRVSRDDLRRVIRNGIPGTYMPSFLLMKDDEAEAILEYVRWLAMRGEMEKRLDDELSADYASSAIDKSYNSAREAYDAAKKAGEKPAAVPSKTQMLKKANEELKEYLTADFPATVSDTADIVAEVWTQGDDPASVVVPSVPRVADTPESRARGRRTYLSDKGKCYTCHGPHGRGDGASATEDFWPKPGSTEKYEERGLHDFWGHPITPRDLTQGQYRGGRRPVDLFRRVHAGIKGTPMPAFGGTVLKDEDIWDVVNYVMSIPFESQTPPQSKPTAVAGTAQTNR
jgi:mono/diheme cytochrome c family protein